MSTPTLNIDRVNARYRIRPGSEQRRQLDGVLALVLDEALEPALERARASISDEHVCIRRVNAPVALALARHGDGALATTWADAIAAAISECLSGDGPDVVRYGSRRHALADMALCVAARQREREWAWRAMGLWPPAESEPARALLVALLDDDGAVAPVLAQVARHGLLRGLVAALTPAAWLELAQAALCSAGAAQTLAARALAEGASRAAMPAAVGRALRRSDIARALRSTGAPAVAVAALALVEVEPATVRALGERLAEALPRRLPAGADADTDADADADAAKAAPADDQRPDDDEPLALAPRSRAASAFGGLAFALHAVVALDLPARFAADLPEVELARSLHALALALVVKADPGDAAALAFAGLAPDAEPPSSPLPGDARAAVAAAARDVHDWLAGRLDEDPAELNLDALLRRAAEIRADPGWIEFHLRIDEIDTAVRRAGLDLDPDHLPFLGCVVRIVYA